MLKSNVQHFFTSLILLFGTLLVPFRIIFGSYLRSWVEPFEHAKEKIKERDKMNSMNDKKKRSMEKDYSLMSDRYVAA